MHNNHRHYNQYQQQQQQQHHHQQQQQQQRHSHVHHHQLAAAPPQSPQSAYYAHHGMSVPRSVSAPYYMNHRQTPILASPPPVAQQSFSPLASPVVSSQPSPIPQNRHSFYHTYEDLHSSASSSSKQPPPRSRSVVSIGSLNSTSTTATKAPDRYHRRKSLVTVAPVNTDSSSPTSASTTPSPTIQAPPPVATVPFQQPQPQSPQVSASSPTDAPSKKQQKQGPTLYNQPGQSNSMTALSKREREDVVIPRHQHQKLQAAQRAPLTPPPLVLPSDVRRHSLASTSSYSRSPTSSPSPTATPRSEHTRSSSSTSLPDAKGVNGILKSSSSVSAASSATVQNVEKKKKKSTASTPVQYHPQQRASTLPPPARPMTAPPVPNYKPPPPPPIKTKRNSSSSPPGSPVSHKQALNYQQQKFDVKKPSNLSITTNLDDQHQPSPKMKFGARLKKALSFGSKKDLNNISPLNQRNSDVPFSATSDRASVISMPTVFQNRKKSVASTRSAYVGPSSPNDTASVYSAKSTTSNMSATFKRMSRGFFGGGRRDVSAPAVVEQQSQQPPLPFVGGSNLDRQSVVAQPVVSHSVAEVEMPKSPGSTLSSLSNVTIQATAPPSPPASIKNEQVAATPKRYSSETESEPIPSLTSSTESASNTEEPEDLAAGDTVFPKSLDHLTVETIRSSLDRTKSLERRRSRRSTRSDRSEKTVDASETLPGATEIHVTSEEVDSINITINETPKKSILKSSNSSIAEEQSVTETAVETKSNTDPTNLINFDFEQEFNLDFDFEKLPDSLPKKIDNNDVIEASNKRDSFVKTHTPKHSKSSSKSSISSSREQPQQQQQSQFHYHPLYRNRISQMVPSGSHHSPHSSIGSSGSYFSTHARNSSINTASDRGSSSSTPTKQKHTVSFSSRIVIYDTYDRSIYDRRAELATCNRLTPTLAQQIKEELNNFKMEMDIHAESRIYTHFF